MVKIIEEVYVDVKYTIELSQKELNTLVHLAGRLNEGGYYNGMGTFVNRDKVLSYMELGNLHETLESKAQYMK